jgi:NTE family protein
VRAGIVDTRGSQIVRVGDPAVSPDAWHVQAGFIRLGFDRLDSANFPRTGKAFSFTLRGEDHSAGHDGADSLTFDWRGAWSHGKNTLVGWMSGGSTIGGTPQARNDFLLGGFLNLSGVAAQSVAAPHYAIARAIYLRSVGTGGEGVLNVPAYAGVSVEMGNAWNQRSDIRLDTARRDYSLFFGADTFLGPAYLAAGYDDAGSTAFYLFLGRTF